ncbi:Salicylate biosynthesis isochorismate synthase [Lacunisphaera limnophila]|uniref:isochorismate synthase n=1 Tax=Lacunisphaera limnophila TaxID=1838286 RepID=A0A1D8AWV8_9BACT|nr:isochorismate synthase [Lacunisphaera limnophila]AOS45380.1 Salicylate biosynthesis isochorismate synthase [Lacunisphaera limnophila]
MKTPPVNPTGSATPEALRGFLAQCAAEARSVGRPQLVSISMAVDNLDPLAVLESIFEPGEPHFYAERPAAGFGVAGAEVAVEFNAAGADRFAAARAFIDRTLADTIAVGPLAEPFAGPHFFFAAGFADDAPAGGAFPALRVQVPRWQVARRGDGTIAVANVLLPGDAPVDLVTAKIWRAHGKFGAFDYSRAKQKARPSAPQRAEEIGGAEAYPMAVRQALAEIARGDYQKVVLARALRYTTAEEFHPMGVLNHLRQRYPECYSFSIANGRGQSFIGASPERLVRVAGGRMHTAALAGSAPRGETASEDAAWAQALLQSEKDLREHRLVLDSIVGRLAGLDLKLEHAAQPRLLGLANVHHLHTPISASLPAGVDILDLVARLHPTPAVGGAPQAPALAALQRLEAFPRGLYAGPQGWVDHQGGGEFFVGIRSALIDGRTATAYAGAGIVAGSEPEKEFAETDLKFNALIGALTQS